MWKSLVNLFRYCFRSPSCELDGCGDFVPDKDGKLCAVCRRPSLAYPRETDDE